MPVCASGGIPKTTTPAWLVLAATAAEFLLTRRFPWLAPFLAFIPVFSYDMSEFCALEPPEMPEWTAADLAGLLVGLNQDKLLQTLQHAVWYEFCQCAPPDPAPIPPTVLAPTNTPTVHSNPVGQCDSVQFNVDTAIRWLNGEGQVNGNFFEYRALPVGATSQFFQAQLNADMPSGTGPVQWQVFFYNDANTQVGGGGPIGSITNAVRNVELSYAVPAAATKWNARTSHPGAPNGPVDITVVVQTYCGGSVNQLRQPCCPPDPGLMSKLDQVAELLLLVQRQGVPFAYVPGLTYSSLSGQGVISFTDPILRLRVNLTTLPGWYGLAEGSPDRLFDVGWIALGTADGMQSPRPITNTPFLLQVPGDITRIGYSFGVGVEATIETFSREP